MNKSREIETVFSSELRFPPLIWSRASIRDMKNVVRQKCLKMQIRAFGMSLVMMWL